MREPSSFAEECSRAEDERSSAERNIRLSLANVPPDRASTRSPVTKLRPLRRSAPPRPLKVSTSPRNIRSRPRSVPREDENVSGLKRKPRPGSGSHGCEEAGTSHGKLAFSLRLFRVSRGQQAVEPADAWRERTAGSRRLAVARRACYRESASRNRSRRLGTVGVTPPSQEGRVPNEDSGLIEVLYVFLWIGRLTVRAVGPDLAVQSASAGGPNST